MKKMLLALCIVQGATANTVGGFLTSLYRRASNFMAAQPKERSDSKSPVKVAFIELEQNPDIRQLALNLITAAKTPEIVGVILQIDNYGGPATVFSYIQDLVRQIVAKKPVVALIKGGAASGGYLVASASSFIISSSWATIGSVGVFSEVHKYKNVKLKGDIEAESDIEVFFAGEHKVTKHPHSGPLSQDERDFIKKELDKAYQHFLSLVIENRPQLSLNDAVFWAEGNVFIPKEAKERGLIDLIGTIFDAEEKVIELIVQKISRSDYQYRNVTNTGDVVTRLLAGEITPLEIEVVLVSYPLSQKNFSKNKSAHGAGDDNKIFKFMLRCPEYVL